MTSSIMSSCAVKMMQIDTSLVRVQGIVSLLLYLSGLEKNMERETSSKKIIHEPLSQLHALCSSFSSCHRILTQNM